MDFTPLKNNKKVEQYILHPNRNVVAMVTLNDLVFCIQRTGLPSSCLDKYAVIPNHMNCLISPYSGQATIPTDPGIYRRTG